VPACRSELVPPLVRREERWVCSAAAMGDVVKQEEEAEEKEELEELEKGYVR
jgi:hypothetical protein